MVRSIGMAGPARALECALCLLLSLCPGWAQTRSARRVEVTDDTVIRLATRVRYTTVVAVPADERILEFVLGDPERWGLVGAANIALLKPMVVGARTSATLVTDAGRIYVFTAEEGAREPDVMVYIQRAVPRPARAELPAVKAARAPVPGPVTAFPAAPVLALVPPTAWAPQSASVAPAAPLPPTDETTPGDVPAPVPVPEPPPVRLAVPGGVTPAAESARDPLPTVTSPAAARGGAMRFEYTLDGAARRDPFLVEAMWNDGERTWFRSPAAGQWDVYAAGDGFGGERVECEPVEEGLCAVRGVLGDGSLRMEGEEAGWKLRPVRDPR